MKLNVGSSDKKIRAYVIAPLAVILALVFHSSPVALVVFLVVAVIMWATAAMNFCPLYSIFRVSTRKDA